MTAVDDVVAAIRAGRPVVLAFDTVYGLAADPHVVEATLALYRLKGRAEAQPSALVARDVAHLLECVPELAGRSAAIARELLPGPFTLIFPNPARRFPRLTGTNPEALGVRVPALTGAANDVLTRVGMLVATSANRPGGRDPQTLADVPEEIRAGSVCLDGGTLPGTPSTVIDLTGSKPRVLREGAVAAEDALRRLQAPVRSG
jgi:L-threonylcarbamoyladenylate synthase